MLGIIGAMDQEVSILKEKMEVKKIDKRASMEFYVGILNGKEVVIVNAVSARSMLLSAHRFLQIAIR